MSVDQTPEALIDLHSAAPLAGGYFAVLAIDADGEPWPWLINACRHCPDMTHGSRHDVPAHEKTGRLPFEIRDALGMVHRCGAPTRQGNGPPCVQVVREAGARCGWHRDQEGSG